MTKGIFQPHINPRRPSHPVPGYPKVQQRADQRLLNPVHILLDEVARPLEVDQRIAHHLPRPVEGHLPTAVGLHHRDVAGHEDVLRLARQPLRENRRMLTNP